MHSAMKGKLPESVLDERVAAHVVVKVLEVAWDFKLNIPEDLVKDTVANEFHAMRGVDVSIEAS